MIVLPRVSVVIPLYNYQDHIADCVDSCMRQDYPHDRYEVIVVDDCSTDNSAYHSQRQWRTDKRFQLIRQMVNRGYSAAKNVGIRKSCGEMIVTLDADDMLAGEDSIVRRAVVMARDPEIGVVHGTQYVIEASGGYDYYMKRRYKLGISKSVKVQAQTTMVRRSVHREFGLYDEDLRSRSDNLMWFRLRDIAGVVFHKLDDGKGPVAFYRKHKKSMVEYRKRNPHYNHQVTRLLEEKKHRLRAEGITKENTWRLKR